MAHIYDMDKAAATFMDSIGIVHTVGGERKTFIIKEITEAFLDDINAAKRTLSIARCRQLLAEATDTDIGEWTGLTAMQIMADIGLILMAVGEMVQAMAGGAVPLEPSTSPPAASPAPSPDSTPTGT